MKPFGIIGGMAPSATISLLRLVQGAGPDHDGGAHVPLIVHHNPQIPARAQNPSQSSSDPMPVLVAMAQDLERAGACALAMPSVTAHQYALAVTHATTLPFLNMLDLTADGLVAKGARSVGVIAPPSVREAGGLENALAGRGLTTIWSKKDTEAGSLAQITSLLSGGADHLLVADLPHDAVFDSVPSGVAVTHSLGCLADAIIAHATSAIRPLEKTG